MSTQNHAAGPFRAAAGNTNSRYPAHIATPARDPADRVALVLDAKRHALLNAHRHRLRRDDLEECLSQAALELVVRARQGVHFASDTHIARTLEQRFLSRINDRRRAIEGRSTAHAELEHAIGGGLFDGAQEQVADPRADVESLVLLRLELDRLARLAAQLSGDQRLVLRSQLCGIECAEFCASVGWSPEKYRKVARRARVRLRMLAESDPGCPVSGLPVG